MKKENSLKNPIIRFLSNFGFVRISTPPQWVLSASADIRTKASHDPFKYYKNILKGKNFVYKVQCENIGQGNCKDKYWVKKK